MVIKNHILYVSRAELLEMVPASYRDELYKTINQGLWRNREGGDSWAHTTERGETFIQYSTIPGPTQTKYDLPPESTLIKSNLSKLVTMPAGAKDFYLSQPETYAYAGEIAQQSAWLLFLAAVTRSQAKSMGYPSMDDLYTDALGIMAKLPRWKCSNIAVLKRKLKPFNRLFKKPLNGVYTPGQLQTALRSLISAKYGNSNSQKVTKEQEALLVQIYSESNKPNIEQAWTMYLREATKMVEAYKASNGAQGWNEKCLVSYSTVKQLLMSKRVQQMVYEARHGYQAYRNEYEIVTRRTAPSFANAMWVLDGSPVHRYYYDPKTKKAYSRLNVFVVLDAHSWCVLGFWVGDNEDTTAVKGALRAACELGQHLPYQLQYDNSSALKSFLSQQCMNAIAEHCTPTSVGNARAKIIEPFFKQFNEQVLRFREGYTASPVMASNINNKPNREALARQVKDGLLPTVDQAVKELHEDFTLWNNRVMKKYQKSPLQRYRESMQATIERQRKYTHTHEVEAFYTMPGELKKVKILEEGKQVLRQRFIPKSYEYTNEGIKGHIVPGVEFNNVHIGEYFEIKYDPRQEEGRIYLYKDQQPYRFEGEHVAMLPREEFSMALVDRVEGEGKALHEHLETKKAQRHLAKERFNELVAITKANGTYTPAITENAFDKEVLNAAKADRMERLVNGSQYQLNSTKGKARKAPVSSVERFDIDEDTKSNKTMYNPPSEALSQPGNKPIERWDFD